MIFEYNIVISHTKPSITTKVFQLLRNQSKLVQASFQNNFGFRIENNVLKGDEVSYTDDYTSLGEFILDRLRSKPDLVGQVDVVTGEEYSYKIMQERSVRCALWMKAQGLLPGDVVTICSHNQLDVAISCFAVLYLGAVISPVDEKMNKKELCHLLSITQPKIAFVNQAVANTMADAAKDARLELPITVFGQVTGFLNFENIIAQPRVSQVTNFEYTPIENPDATAFIMCTSGTTGPPKGVALGHAALLRQMHLANMLGMAGNICIIFTGLSWITGILNLFMCLFLNIPRLIVPPFEEHSACRLIEKYKVTWILVSSHIINRLLKSCALEQYNLSSLKDVFCGGSSLSNAAEEAFTKIVLNARIFMSYGITEIGGIVSRKMMTSPSGSCGRIVENAQLKVIDPCTGQIMGVNQKGELLLKTAMMMNGYYRNPQATAHAIDHEGWMHSGDLGYYDEDGQIFIVDRLKELIKYRGHHISPSDIESLILSHPGVKDVAVVGLPHPQDGEHPLALVVRAADSFVTDNEVTEKELLDLVSAEVSDSRRLRGGVRFVDHIPRTSSSKIQRKELREFARSIVTLN